MADKNSVLKAALSELSNFPIFHGLEIKDIEKLCEDGQIVVTPHRETLYHFGEDANYFGIVLSGAYKLSKPMPSGDDAILYFSTSGDVVAAFIMSQPSPKYPVSVIAMGPSRFLKIPRDRYLKTWIQFPEIILRIQNLLSTRIGKMHAQRVLTKASLPTKLAFLLIDILKKSNSHDDLILPLPITRKELADNLGTSVESIIRIMSEWSKNGLIETKDHQIKILNLEKMLQLTNQ